MRVARTVYAKELLETLRDRRTVIVMILLPLCLYPLLAVGMTQWMSISKGQQAKTVSTIALTGPEWAPLTSELQANPLTQVERVSKTSATLGHFDAVIKVPKGFRERLAASKPVDVEVSYNETVDRSRLAHKRLKKLLSRFSKQLFRRRVAKLGLPERFDTPLNIKGRSTTTSGQRSRHLMASALPVLVVLMVLLGAFYPAIDVTAGERERETLEVLLTTPASRISLMAGKYLAVATIATMTGFLNLMAVGATMAMGFSPALQKLGVTLTIPWSSVALVVIALIPTSLFFSAVMVAVASLARSFKEAQNLLTPIYLVCMMPAFMALLPGTELTYINAVVPTINIALLVKGLIAGSVPVGPAIASAVSTCIYAAIALRIAASIFSSESLLFGASLIHRFGRGAVGRVKRQAPTLGEGITVLAIAMILFLLAGVPLQRRSLVSGLLITEWVLILGPALLLIALRRLDAKAVLSLHKPKPFNLFGAVLAGASTWVLVVLFVEFVQQRFLPMSPEVAEAMRKSLLGQQRPLALDALVFSLSPAICEEVLFRGILLSASRRVMSTRAAVILNAALFGLFHLNVYRFLPTALLGGALAYGVVRTRSIVPAMIFHAANNFCLIALARITPTDSQMPPALMAAAIGGSLVGLWLFWRTAKSSPATLHDP